jgi:hypothetical protein
MINLTTAACTAQPNLLILGLGNIEITRQVLQKLKVCKRKDCIMSSTMLSLVVGYYGDTAKCISTGKRKNELSKEKHQRILEWCQK